MQPTDPDKFTDKAWEAIVKSQDIVRAYNQQQLDVEHLMLALLEQDNGLASKVLSRAGVETERLQQQLEDFTRRQPKVGRSEQLYLGKGLDRMLDGAEDARQGMNDAYISVEHLLLAFAEEERIGRRIFRNLNATSEDLEDAIKGIRGSQKVTDQNPESRYEALDKFGRDLTEEA